VHTRLVVETKGWGSAVADEMSGESQPAVQHDGAINLRPSIQILNSFRTQGYKEWWALAEFVDNSISAFVLNEERLKVAEGPGFRLKIKIKFDSQSGQIVVGDNATGIFDSDLARAFQAGSPPPNKGSLSQFGLGLKAAGIWFGDNVVVKTKALGEPYQKRIEIDLPTINRTNMEEVHAQKTPADPRQHGTQIILSKLVRPVPAKAESVGTIAEYLASIYRGFLRSGKVTIEILVVSPSGREKGINLSFEEPAFLVAPHWNHPTWEPVLWKKEINFTTRSGKHVTGWAGLREFGSYSNTGLVLLWNGKVIIGSGTSKDVRGSSNTYKPYVIFRNPNSAASLRLFGELDVSEFETTTRKDDLNWGSAEEDDFLEQLRTSMESSPRELITMAYKYRSIENTSEVVDSWKAATDDVGRVVAEVLSDPTSLNSIGSTSEEIIVKLLENQKEEHHGGWVAEYFYPTGSKEHLRIRIGYTTVPNADTLIIRRDAGDDEACEVLINRGSKFALAYLDPLRNDLGPIYRIFAALAISELSVINITGEYLISAIRQAMNEILASDHMTRLGDK
jgi:hypothetical protein